MSAHKSSNGRVLLRATYFIFITILAGCAATDEQRKLPASSVQVDVSNIVDPELRGFATATMGSMKALKGFTEESLPKVRASLPVKKPLSNPEWNERVISSESNASGVHVYVINAAAPNSKHPAILHVHGGGFVAGTAMGSVRDLQELAATLDCVIVSVDYRLAPETKFPGSLNDNYAALKWLYINAAELGVDKTRIAVMGESAGGGHAAMLAIAARDRGEVPIVLEALLYPMLDDRTGSTRAVPAHIGTILWTANDNRFGWTSLLGVPAGSEKIPYGAAPARVSNLAGLPPTFIAVGSIDLFVQEDLAYSQRLIEAGVPTELLVVPGAYHGFDMVREANVTKQFRAVLTNAFTRAFREKDAHQSDRTK